MSDTLIKVHRSSTRCARRGMTLIELVVSALLAGMMLTALVSVVWSSSRETVMLRNEMSGSFPVTQLAQRMRTDFINARGIATDARGFTLHGFLGTGPDETRNMLTVARVRYEIASVGGRPTLVRISNSRREPVWLGCGAIDLKPLDVVDAENASLPRPEAGGLPEAPGRFRVTMIGDDGKLLWREVIHHHDQ